MHSTKKNPTNLCEIGTENRFKIPDRAVSSVDGCATPDAHQGLENTLLVMEGLDRASSGTSSEEAQAVGAI